ARQPRALRGDVPAVDQLQPAGRRREHPPDPRGGRPHGAAVSDSPTLRVAGLAVAYGRAQVVDGVGFDLAAGRITGMVGESGCGKSTSALAAIGYVPPGGRILAGRAELEGRDLLTLPHHALREVWGRDVAYVAQNAGTALNPALTVGRQL